MTKHGPQAAAALYNARYTPTHVEGQHRTFIGCPAMEDILSRTRKDPVRPGSLQPAGVGTHKDPTDTSDTHDNL